MFSKRYAFTLIELVVAIGLLTVVATITAISGATFYKGYQNSLQVTEHLKELMAIDNLMDTHVRNLVPFKWKDEEGTERMIFNGKEDELFFATLRRSYGKRPGSLLFVRVFVEEEQLIAEYSPYPRFPWLEEDDDNMPWTREVIARNVSQITFAYAENSTETEGTVEFLETYLEEENSSPPLAVRMTVEWTNGEKEQWLRRTAGVSANSTFGVRTSAAGTTETTTVSSGQSNTGTSSTAGSGGVRPGQNMNFISTLVSVSVVSVLVSSSTFCGR